MISLREHLERVEARKRQLGMRDTDADVDAMRNPGTGRTDAKRRLLECVDARVSDAGAKAVISRR